MFVLVNSYAYIGHVQSAKVDFFHPNVGFWCFSKFPFIPYSILMIWKLQISFILLYHDCALQEGHSYFVLFVNSSKRQLNLACMANLIFDKAICIGSLLFLRGYTKALLYDGKQTFPIVVAFWSVMPVGSSANNSIPFAVPISQPKQRHYLTSILFCTVIFEQVLFLLGCRFCVVIGTKTCRTNLQLVYKCWKSAESFLKLCGTQLCNPNCTLPCLNIDGFFFSEICFY